MDARNLVYITACVYTRRIPLRACVRVCVRSLVYSYIIFYVPKSCQTIAIPKMGKLSQNGKLRSFIFIYSEGCRNTCTYNSCLYNDRLLVYCVCVCVCLLRAIAYCVCVRDLMQGLIGVSSPSNLSRKHTRNTLSLNDLHLHLGVEIGWLLFFTLTSAATNVKA